MILVIPLWYYLMKINWFILCPYLIQILSKESHTLFLKVSKALCITNSILAMLSFALNVIVLCVVILSCGIYVLCCFILCRAVLYCPALPRLGTRTLLFALLCHLLFYWGRFAVTARPLFSANIFELGSEASTQRRRRRHAAYRQLETCRVLVASFKFWEATICKL